MTEDPLESVMRTSCYARSEQIVEVESNGLTHDNVGHNPSAAYLFIEEGTGYVGKRLSLTVMGEEADIEKIKAIRRRTAPPISEEESKFLVHFHIEGVRPSGMDEA